MPSKTLIYIVAIDSPDTKVKVNDYFQFSRPTWEHYCKRHDIDLIVRTTHLFDDPSIKPIWNKEMISVIGKDYDKIGIVDGDTMIRWDAPNIFDQIGDDDFAGVNDLCDLDWLFSSIAGRQHFFPEVTIDIDKYLNAGVLFFGKRYLSVFKELLLFYLENQSEIDSIKTGGKEQTLLNFVLQKRKVNKEKSEIFQIKKLSPAWNLLSIHRKNMFISNWQLKVDNTPYFMKYAYLWHFTGFPIEDRVSVMKQTWEMTKHLYV